MGSGWFASSRTPAARPPTVGGRGDPRPALWRDGEPLNDGSSDSPAMGAVVRPRGIRLWPQPAQGWRRHLPCLPDPFSLAVGLRRGILRELSNPSAASDDSNPGGDRWETLGARGKPVPRDSTASDLARRQLVSGRRPIYALQFRPRALDQELLPAPPQAIRKTKPNDPGSRRSSTPLAVPDPPPGPDQTSRNHS